MIRCCQSHFTDGQTEAQGSQVIHWKKNCYPVARLCFFFLKIDIFIFYCIGSYLWHIGSFILQCGVFIVVQGLLSSYGIRAPEHVGSVVLVHGFSCSSAWGILVPWPGIKPESPAWKGRFLTPGLPGEFQGFAFTSQTHYFSRNTTLSARNAAFCEFSVSLMTVSLLLSLTVTWRSCRIQQWILGMKNFCMSYTCL